MKKRIILCMTAILFSCIHLQADVISIVEFDQKDFNSFIEGNLPDVIVKCPKGTRFPFAVNITGDLFYHEGQPLGTLRVKKTLYTKCIESGIFLFSTDQETWKSFSDFFIGKMLATLKIEEDHPVAGLDLEVTALNP